MDSSRQSTSAAQTVLASPTGDRSASRGGFSDLNRGFIFALTANVLWGTSFLASKYTLAVWGPLTASVLRFLVAVISLGFGIRATGRQIARPKNNATWFSIVGVAAFGFGILYPLQLQGLKLIPSSLSASIMLCSPILLIVLGTLLLNERARWNKWLALVLGVLGGIILLNPSRVEASPLMNDFSGSILTLAAAASLALSVIFTRKIGNDLDAPSTTFWSMLLGLLMIAPFTMFEPGSGTADRTTFILGVAALIYLGVVCSAVCFLIWNRAISLASPNQIASTMHVKTPIAIILGIFVGGEPLSWKVILGTALVAIGIWISQLSVKPNVNGEAK